MRSLATSDARAAKLRACRLYIASENLFSALRMTPMLTEAQLARMVQDFYSLLLGTENLCRLREQPIDEVRAQVGLGTSVQSRSGHARRWPVTGSTRRGFSLRACCADRASFSKDLPPDDLARAGQAMLRAGIDAAEALKARYEGDFDHEPRDRLLKMQLDALDEGAPQAAKAAPPQAAEMKEPATNAPLFSAVGAAFRASQVATKTWDNQTASEAGATYRLFVDVWRPAANFLHPQGRWPLPRSDRVPAE